MLWFQSLLANNSPDRLFRRALKLTAEPALKLIRLLLPNKVGIEVLVVSGSLQGLPLPQGGFLTWNQQAVGRNQCFMRPLLQAQLGNVVVVFAQLVHRQALSVGESDTLAQLLKRLA